MKQKIALFISIVLLLITTANAQIEDPVKWSYTAKKLADKSFELHIAANLEKNWHIYAQDAGDGPEPTSFTFTATPVYTAFYFLDSGSTLLGHFQAGSVSTVIGGGGGSGKWS